jgi:hypothetical protein
MALWGGGPPLLTEKFGYSCNVWYSVKLSELLFSSIDKRAWFAISFNPVENVPSSNPCSIYEDVSTAVQTGDVGSRMIANYRSQLISIVDDLLAERSITADEARDYRQEIAKENIVSFRPEIWRLDLEKISQRKYGAVDIDKLKSECKENANRVIQDNPPQVLQPDEYLILDLQDSEYETVIVG